ncbi:MAG: hypothetical protein LQ346_006634, partial [Caloplaca aetnensis]
MEGYRQLLLQPTLSNAIKRLGDSKGPEDSQCPSLSGRNDHREEIRKAASCLHATLEVLQDELQNLIKDKGLAPISGSPEKMPLRSPW